jgi:hypothetical protein
MTNMFITLEEAAVISRRSSFTVRRAAKSGALDHTRGMERGGNRGRILVTEESVIAWTRAGCPTHPLPTPPAATSQGAA